MKKTITILLTLFIISSFVDAQEDNFSQFDINIYEGMSASQDIMNQFIDSQKDNTALNTLLKTFGNEIVELELTDTGEIVTLSLKDGKIESIDKGKTGNATTYFRTSMEEIASLQNAEDPAATILDLVNTGKIEYGTTEKAGFFTKLVLWISKILAKIVYFVKGLLGK